MTEGATAQKEGKEHRLWALPAALLQVLRVGVVFQWSENGQTEPPQKNTKKPHAGTVQRQRPAARGGGAEERTALGSAVGADHGSPQPFMQTLAPRRDCTMGCGQVDGRTESRTGTCSNTGCQAQRAAGRQVHWKGWSQGEGGMAINQDNVAKLAGAGAEARARGITPDRGRAVSVSKRTAQNGIEKEAREL